jgi:hypothetical protein
MGEPLCHPQLPDFLEAAENHGFKVILTTNGTLLEKQKENLLDAPALHKVTISLHAFEANDLDVPFNVYLQRCFDFGKAAEGKKLIVYRLWNQGGADQTDTAACHQLLHALGLGTGVIVAVAFQQVNCAPHAETGTQSDNEGLQNTNCGIEKSHKLCTSQKFLEGTFRLFS